jgi:hypothetical protein
VKHGLPALAPVNVCFRSTTPSCSTSAASGWPTPTTAGRGHTVETRYSFAERIRKMSHLYDRLLKEERGGQRAGAFRDALSP